jgi:hypothetical protein
VAIQAIGASRASCRDGKSQPSEALEPDAACDTIIGEKFVKRSKQLPSVARYIRSPQPLGAPENPIAAKHLSKMRALRMARTLTQPASLAAN